jgi:hypothetical protein
MFIATKTSIHEPGFQYEQSSFEHDAECWSANDMAVRDHLLLSPQTYLICPTYTCRHAVLSLSYGINQPLERVSCTKIN